MLKQIICPIELKNWKIDYAPHRYSDSSPISVSWWTAILWMVRLIKEDFTNQDQILYRLPRNELRLIHLTVTELHLWILPTAECASNLTTINYINYKKLLPSSTQKLKRRKTGISIRESDSLRISKFSKQIKLRGNLLRIVSILQVT